METGKALKIRNQVELYLFCAGIGAVAGALIWAVLKVMAVGMEALWVWIPERVTIPCYTIVVCMLGALLAGLMRKKYGDYPEELETVIGKVKTEKRYEYKNMLVMMLSALLPLLLGSSVGPEAGLTGIIVGLCYWAGDNLKIAKQHVKEYSKVGIAVSLSVLFQAPLFGIFEVEEEPEIDARNISGGSKIVVYGVSLAAATGCYAGLSALFGAGLSGFPSFEMVEIGKADYALMLVYVLCGCLLAFFYEGVHHVTKRASNKVPVVLRELICGAVLGVIGTWLPAVMFSGEEQMGVLMLDYMKYVPFALIGIAFLKIFLTNLCIQFGLKGGHFFPLIFAGVCMGYGCAMLFFENPAQHVVFAAAIVTASLLGGTMKKPLAVTMLLFLCFPIKLFIWIFFAAAISSKIPNHLAPSGSTRPS